MRVNNRFLNKTFNDRKKQSSKGFNGFDGIKRRNGVGKSLENDF